MFKLNGGSILFNAYSTFRLSGSMCYTSSSIHLENAYATENDTGVWQWLFGKSISSMVLQNTGTTDGFVGITTPSLARILPVCSHLNYVACLVGHIMLDG